MDGGQEIYDQLEHAFGLEKPEVLSRQAILEALERVLSRMLAGSADAFFQLMYRMDIPEGKLMDALSDRSAGVHKVAVLILDRHVQKYESRHRNKERGEQADEDLKW